MAQTANAVISPEARTFHRELSTVHRALKRGLQSIIDAAPSVSPHQQPAFLKYCKAFFGFLHSHHHHEDEIAFPMLANACGVKQHIAHLEEDHQDLVNLLDAFESAFQSKVFDGKAIARTASDLNQKMREHLDYEESVFALDVLARAPGTLLMKTLNKIKAAAKKGDPFLLLPFFVKNMTKEEAKYMIFDDEPWIFSKVLYPLIFSRVNKDAWAFASKPTATAASAA